MIKKSLATLFVVLLLSGAWGLFGEVPAGALQAKPMAQNEIPSVDFCELVKHPTAYFDKTIRITATYEIGEEGSNLNNLRCVRSHDDSIGAGFLRVDEAQIKAVNRSIETIMAGKAGPQPRVTVVGLLRNSSRHDFAWYRYRFDIIRFEELRDDITQRIVNYQSTLQAGLTYRALVNHDKDFGLSFTSPLRILIHQAISLEWVNLKEFGAFRSLREGEQKQIVFRVVDDHIQQMTPRRWDRTFQLEILLVE